MVGAVFPPCSLAWGQTMRQRQPPPRGLMPACGTSQYCCSQRPWPRGKSLLTHAFSGDSWTVISKSGSVSCGFTAPFSWVLVHTGFCWCCPSVLISPGLWNFCIQIPLVLKVKFPVGSQPLCWVPRLENLLRGRICDLSLFTHIIEM